MLWILKSREPSSDLMDLYLLSLVTKMPLSKLGAWGTGRRVEGEKGGKKEMVKIHSPIINNKL